MDQLEKTHFRLPLPQDWLRGTPVGDLRHATRYFLVAAGVVDPAIHLSRVLPDPVASVVQVNLLEVFLADRADAILQNWVAGDGNVLESWYLGGRSLTTGRARIRRTVFINGLTTVDPVLKV